MYNTFKVTQNKTVININNLIVSHYKGLKKRGSNGKEILELVLKSSLIIEVQIEFTTLKNILQTT
jgi:hypothetical protein